MSGAGPIRVALVEDDDRTRDGLRAVIDADPAFELSGAHASMEEALPALLARPPDVLLADVGLGGMSGIEGVRRYRARHPEALVLMLSVMGDDRNVFEAVCAGAHGYLLKDTPPEGLRAALRELVAGGAPLSPQVARRVLSMFRVLPRPEGDHGLSPRELDVLRAFARGHSYKTAAVELDLSLDTVRFHVRHVYAKLHVHSKSEAVLTALRRGLV